MAEIKLEKRLPNLTPEEEVIFTEAILEAYHRGRTDAAKKWIPVGERLPQEKYEICKTVILRMDDGVVTVGWLNKDRGSGYYLPPCDDFISKVPLSRFTHWMPLPEPPKEGDGNG